VCFPLGDKTKDEVRALARRFRLPNAGKPDSQQICFIPDGDHVAFVEAHGGGGRPGAIVDEASGEQLGSHAGTHRFTVGQRRGVPAGPPGPAQRRFVLRVDAASGEVRVGPREQLGREALRVSDVRWLSRAPARWPLRCEVQIRHRAPAGAAWIHAAPDPARAADHVEAGGAVDVRLDQPAFGVAPGQAAVFYDQERQLVLGGGWID
jgi:tRNA-specific 2-thiouridylase